MIIEEVEDIFCGLRNGEEAAERGRDFDILGIGGRRVVVRSEGGVWKIPWAEGGERDNEIELRIWQSADRNLQKMLCPILANQSHSIMQAECIPISFEAAGADGLGIVASLAREGISDVAVNLGLFEERLICYDYSYISPELYSQLFVS